MQSAAAIHSGRGEPSAVAERGAAAQRVLDAGRAGEQRVVPRLAVDLDRPQRNTVAAAQRQHELECPLDRRATGSRRTRGPTCCGSGGTHRRRCTRTRWCRSCRPRSIRRSRSTRTSRPSGAACRRATRRPAPPRRGGRRRRAPSPTRRGSTGRNAHRRTRGSSRTASCSDARWAAVRWTSSADTTPSSVGQHAHASTVPSAGFLTP